MPATCPLVLRPIKVRSLSIEFNEVAWELEPTMHDVLDYTFQVMRSESVEGPFDLISDEFSDLYLFIDNSIKALHRYRQLFYKVRVKNKLSGEFWDFGPGYAEQEEDRVAKELRSHILLLMREFIGERCWVLPVRTFGQRCPDCWDNTLKKKTRSGCRTCYDKSFIRGYFSPIETWISLDPSPAGEQFTNVGKLQPNDTTARLPYYPPLKPGDLVIDPVNERWVVTQVSKTRHVGTSVHQEVRLHQVPESAIEYTIPLELGQPLMSMFLKPARNFTNPQNLEAVDEDTMQDIFAVYRVRGRDERAR